MKSFTITKPTRKQVVGLLIMVACIISTLITTQFYKGWKYSRLEINFIAIGYILIVGFSIIDKKYWLMILLLPLWFFGSQPSGDWTYIEITNNSSTSCQIKLIVPANYKTKEFSLPADNSKTINAGWDDEIILIYQYPNQPKQAKHLQRPAKQNTIEVQLSKPITKPKGK